MVREQWRPGVRPANTVAPIAWLTFFVACALLATLIGLSSGHTNEEQLTMVAQRFPGAKEPPTLGPCPGIEHQRPREVEKDGLVLYYCGTNVVGYRQGRNLHILIKPGDVLEQSAKWLGFKPGQTDFCGQEKGLVPRQATAVGNDICVVSCGNITDMRCAHRVFVNENLKHWLR